MVTSLALEPPRLKIPASAVRLVFACTLSLLLHMLLLGLPVNPAGGRAGEAVPPTAMQVRIEAPAPPAPPMPDIAQTETTEVAVAATVAPPPAPAANSSAGMHLQSPRDSIYYNVSALDVKPEALVQDRPLYPDAAADAGVYKGQVKVELFIDEFGVVNDVRVVSADPPGYFEPAVLDYFRQKRFSPGQLHGLPVKTRGIVPVNFEMGGMVTASPGR